jgi:crotonobetainyl-CoA:carnitine CoA-transferase CaiB-like acyl-CoA transferase
MAGPLSHIRVLDLSRVLAGPWAGQNLADLGAEVIKVEAPGGDPGRSYVPVQFNTENRNKRSFVLNLKSSLSSRVVEKLVSKTDVVIEGFRPGVAKRLHIDFESLAKINSTLIYCSISGYGQTGPWRERPGHDVNYVAAAGGLAYPGQWLKPPARSSLPVADMAGGAFAAIAILSSLHQRDQTGKGASLDLSLFESAFFMAAMRHSLDPQVDPRAHIFPVNDIFECQDGRRLTLGILEEHFWENFRKVVPGLDGDEYSSDQKRRANGDALSKKLSDTMKTKTSEEWISLLEANDIPVDLCVTPAEAAVGNRQLVERQAATKGFATFPVFADGRRGGALRAGVPEMGAHTREILVELGFDDGEVADLFKSRTVLA